MIVDAPTKAAYRIQNIGAIFFLSVFAVIIKGIGISTENKPAYLVNEIIGVVIKDINAQVMSSNANRIVGRIIAKPIIINNTFTTKGFFLNVPKA